MSVVTELKPFKQKPAVVSKIKHKLRQPNAHIISSRNSPTINWTQVHETTCQIRQITAVKMADKRALLINIELSLALRLPWALSDLPQTHFCQPDKTELDLWLVLLGYRLAIRTLGIVHCCLPQTLTIWLTELQLSVMLWGCKRRRVGWSWFLLTSIPTASAEFIVSSTLEAFF